MEPSTRTTPTLSAQSIPGMSVSRRRSASEAHLPPSPRTPKRVLERPIAAPGSAALSAPSSPCDEQQAAGSTTSTPLAFKASPQGGGDTLTKSCTFATPTRSARNSTQTPTPPPSGDRFVPTRGVTCPELLASFASRLKFDNCDSTGDMTGRSAAGVQYNEALAQTLMPSTAAKGKTFLSFRPSPAKHEANLTHSNSAAILRNCQPHQELRKIYRENLYFHSEVSSKSYCYRPISTTPERILDAPELIDDFYLNLLSWSSRNVLAVALGSSVYLWNATSGAISRLVHLDSAIVTALDFSSDGTRLAVGTSSAQVRFYDVGSLQESDRFTNSHNARVGVFSWNGNNLCSSGSRDATICCHDVRSKSSTARLLGHRNEVCGLAWSPDGRQLASGGNDNLLKIWDASRMSTRSGAICPQAGSSRGLNAQTDGARWTMTQHSAAVKALAWCPLKRQLLASGGGSQDRTIRFWNTGSGELRKEIDTQSQVCGIIWSKKDMELVSSHGFSHNQLTLWRYPSMTKMAELTGHSSRVLHLAQSPDGETVVSGAADETLRFWKVFAPQQRTKTRHGQYRRQSAANVLSIR